MYSNGKTKPAGFWIRLLATWIDCAMIYALLTVAFYLFLYTAPYLYFPFNFTFFVVGLIYATVCTGLWGQTSGKYLLGIIVCNKDGNKLPFYKSVLREIILKIISGIVLMIGFCWIGFTKKKLAWHDYMVQSKVVMSKRSVKFASFWKIAAMASLLIFSCSYVWNIVSDISEAKKINLDTAAVSLPFMKRDSLAVTDISTIKEDSSFVSWLDMHAASPEAYALKMAATHQVILLGELHENADNLNFLNQIIPVLYHRSGVRVVAMEVINSEMNDKVTKLVNGKLYDTAIAMEIARAQCWKLWGFKEYWDVLKTVWQLNKSLPDTAERMKLVGLDPDWTMPNLALLGIQQDSKGKAGFWEKFRVFSAIKDLPRSANRDQLMARAIEKEVIEKNKKAIVWIGVNHTLVNFCPTVKKGNQTVIINPRFGVLLSQRHPNKFFQIIMHQNLFFSDADTSCNASVVTFIDSVMLHRQNKPAGFTIAASPFEKLRDGCLTAFTKYKSVCYGDIAQGLIFLAPHNKHSQCAWMPGYISDKMFMEYKPLYDQLFGQNPQIKFKNATELNKTLVDNLTEGNQ